MVTAVTRPDYSLVGRDARLAEERGLAFAEWYHYPIPRKELKELMKRSDRQAIRDTVIWFVLLGISALGAYVFWGKWACAPFVLIYGILYGTFVWFPPA